MSTDLITRNHLLLTEDYAISGLISPMAGRLVDHLRNVRKPYLSLRDGRVLDLKSRSIESANDVLVTVNSILLAHEYIDAGSDQHLRGIHAQHKRIPVRLKLQGIPQATLQGTLEESGLDWQTPFVVLTKPELDLDGESDSGHQDILRGLAYIIVNRDRINLLIRGQTQ
jgi:hypothetical protein